jgi:cytochrome c biogenesis protein CcmG, thiol:disulfide interchange protein DsbE
MIRSPSPAHLKHDERRTIWTIALVAVVSLAFGLLALPRIGSKALAPGGMAPDFSLPVVVGGEPNARISLSNYRGKVVVLDFWATWCKPCAEQARILEQFLTAARRDVAVLGVNQGEEAETVRAYYAQHAPGYPIVLDGDERVGQAFSVRGLPTLVVVDGLGRVTASSSGVVSYARLERLVAEAAVAR